MQYRHTLEFELPSPPREPHARDGLTFECDGKKWGKSVMSVWKESGQSKSSGSTSNFIPNCEIVIGQQMPIPESVDAKVLISWTSDRTSPFPRAFYLCARLQTNKKRKESCKKQN